MQGSSGEFKNQEEEEWTVTDETLIHSAGIKREKKRTKKRRKKAQQMTDLDQKKKKEGKTLLDSQTRGMHTSSAEYTTFITFEPINRKSGGKATHITAFRKLREEGTKNKKSSPKHQLINLSERRVTRGVVGGREGCWGGGRGGRVRWRLLGWGPIFFFFLRHKKKKSYTEQKLN